MQDCPAGATWAVFQWPQADVRCISFGSPKVGNSAFVKAFRSLVGTSFRVVHGGDPIPTLPPSFLCVPYAAVSPVDAFMCMWTTLTNWELRCTSSEMHDGHLNRMQ